MAKTLIIAATSSRGYVQAAVACGYQVIVLDAFIDKDTSKLCKQTFKLKFDDFILDEAHFKQLFLEMLLQINPAEVEGFLYGSLFDNCPDVLNWVATQLPVIGHSAEVLKKAKDFSFFALLDSLNIAHPEVQISLPSQPENWLSKQIGGCGGMHIQPAFAAKPGYYFQQIQAGTSVSMLFMADGRSVKAIGFNQQLIAPTKSLAYRFAGAVSNVALQPNIHKAFEYAAQALTNALHLRGVCSLDAIVGKDSAEGENVWVLELNPRLSATFHLYENLLLLHLQACAGQLCLSNVPTISVKMNSSNAQLILYADEALNIPKNFAWPSWVVDIPTVESHDSNIKSSVKISQRMPICTVLASAESAELAHSLVLQRAQKLTEMLTK